MNVGDIVVCRGIEYGIILELDQSTKVLVDEDLSEIIVWARIMWSDGKVTWEDLIASQEDRLFTIVISACKKD
tara:strand:+ start:800 stop:1018 length:219 start_codon:yes stop_codon:yes gene_type:complete